MKYNSTCKLSFVKQKPLKYCEASLPQKETLDDTFCKKKKAFAM